MDAQDHWGRIDDRAFEIVRQTLQVLDKNQIEYVLTGGWAVYAYGSNVPSVDTDVFVTGDGADQLRAAMKRHDVTVRAGARIEPLALTMPNYILGPDPEMGEPERSYVPAQVFEGQTSKRSVLLPDGAVDATVPDAHVLLFTKLKAFHDRHLAWQAWRDPGVMARLPPTDRAGVREYTEGYYLRKAGKDLYDIAFLAAHHHAFDAAMDLVAEHDMQDWIWPVGPKAAAQVLNFARDLCRDDPGTMKWLGEVQVE